MNTSAATRSGHVERIRPLGAKITFVEREWLPNIFRRIGFEFGVSAKDIARWCGLPSIGPEAGRRLGQRISDAMCDQIGRGLGVPTGQLRTTVMSHLPGEVVSLGSDGIPRPLVNWTRGAGTRFCVQCLRERPGVFYTHWRLWWCFICDRHNTTLRGSCPSCHSELAEAAIVERWCRDPTVCWARLHDGSSCQHALTSTWDEEPLGAASPMVRAQMAIGRAWADTPSLLPHIPTATLRGTAIALLAAEDTGHIAALAEVNPADLAGLFDHSNRNGAAPPREPLAMAALMGAAYRLITDPELAVRTTIRHVTFARPVRITEALEGPGSARYLLNFWPGVDARMRGRVLRAVDQDLPPIQRLIHGSAASADVSEWFEAVKESQASADGHSLQALQAVLNAPGGALSTEWGDRSIPPALWPTWAAPLGVDPRTDPTVLQVALADAVRIAGTGTDPDIARIAGIGRRLRPQLLGSGQQTTEILQALCDLALLLRVQPGPIDYRARRQIPDDQLLLEEQWQALSASVGEHPGKHRRLLNARRYAYLRMSAAAPGDLPARLGFDSSIADDVAAYTQFIVTMSAELKVAIDQYLVGWLHRFERLRPGYPGHDALVPTVEWTPPRIRGTTCLAPELNDIDLPKLHDLLASGIVTLGQLSRGVQRTPRHVRWAIAAHPLPSGNLITPIDWIRELATLPDYAINHVVRSTPAGHARTTVHRKW